MQLTNNEAFITKGVACALV